MIGNIHRISHVGPLLKYLTNRPEASLLAIDSLTRDPEKFPREIELLNAQRQRLEKGAAHAMLALRPTESLTPEAWREVVEEARRLAGYAHAPMLAIRHTDRRHDHVHLIFGVTRFDGSAVPDRFEKKRFQAIAQEIAVRRGFERVVSEKTRPYPKEYWRHVHGDRLLDAVKDAWAEPSPRAFQDRLIAQGVEPAYHLRRSDGHLQGLKFRFEGRWVKARALGKQYAAAAFRRKFRIRPEDVQEMLRQNQKLGLRHDPVVVKVSGAERAGLPRGAAYRVSVDSIDVVPALHYTSKTPPVRLPADFQTYAKRLREPYLDPTFIDKLHTLKDREPTWLVAPIARTLNPRLRDDPLAEKACRIMAHHLLKQPERNPALILELAKDDRDPRFSPLLAKLRESFEPSRFLPSFQEAPERYAPLMTSIAKLRSEIVEAELARTPIAAANLRHWEGRVLSAGRARRVEAVSTETLRRWRRELASGKRTDFADYLRAYKSRWERQLHDTGPELAALVRELESRPPGADRMAELVRAGHVEQLRIFLAKHHPRALTQTQISGRARPAGRARIRAWRPKSPRGALRTMRSPVRGLLSTFARRLGIPYAGILLLPPALVMRQLRSTFKRAAEVGLDLDKHQKTLFRLAQGRLLSAVILNRDVITR